MKLKWGNGNQREMKKIHEKVHAYLFLSKIYFFMIHCELLILEVRIYYSVIACKPTMSVYTLIQLERGISHLSSKSGEKRNDTN